MYFPVYRPRRLRKTETIRRMVRETLLSVDDLIYPIFVVEKEGVKKEVNSMPGVFQLSIDFAVEEAKEAESLGIPAVILFGIPKIKDEFGTSAYDDEGVIQKAVRAIKENTSSLCVITDVCLCEYTSHGHCGIVKSGDVENDETLRLLSREALSHAKAGADIVAPSDMMDGRVGAIRKALDMNGYEDVAIMSYSAKFASSYYGPFRDAAESAPQFGDRKSYQMDISNSDEALREVELDIQEGADIVMVKPALAYLDIIYRVKTTFKRPVCAYNVSGEYSMIKAAGKLGWIDEEKVIFETLLAIKRAGADMIITYFAKEVAKILS